MCLNVTCPLKFGSFRFGHCRSASARANVSGDPYLVFSELQTESGQNDQKGFMQILK